MELALGSAASLLGKVWTTLSDGLVAAYVDSLELGHNSDQIKDKLLQTQGLLHNAQAQGSHVGDNLALQRLLEKLRRDADQAEDLLDEVHYFHIHDRLHSTNYATTQDLDGLVRGQTLHARSALRHTLGSWFQCFSCSRTPKTNRDGGDAAAAAVASAPRHVTNSSSAAAAVAGVTNSNSASADDGDTLRFDRVSMSREIKSLLQGMQSHCDSVSNLLSSTPINNTAVVRHRPQTGSMIIQDTLYGRTDTIEETVNRITDTGATKTVSVLPIVGPGGIGKTTFTTHLYNDARTQEHFQVRVWVCVSTDFDVLRLTKEILTCILAAQEEKNSGVANETTNLDQLQKSIAQRIKSKRFLIVLDDIWKCDSQDQWKTLLAPFTKGDTKGSMLLVTTRFPKVADMVKTVDPLELRGLESNHFFTFFEACIFGEDDKPEHYKDELAGIAQNIANKLKGSPLAAKTVGRLLHKDLSQKHWNGVLEKDEWLKQKNNYDIMPSLKISYDYLPFDLKKCSSYCGLFPEDHEFTSSEINHFWVAIGIIDSNHQADRNYLEELVDSGFLMKKFNWYVMHDLMHELSKTVSAQECLNISSLDFRADAIPQSVRHLSINIEDRYIANFEEEMCKLRERIDIANLRSLMIFREYEEERIAKLLKDSFKEINSLRVLFIVVKSAQSFPYRFSKLIHLEYLKISSSYNEDKMSLPSTLSRFYHLKFLDLDDWCGTYVDLDAKLMSKRNLKELELLWGRDGPTTDADILDALQPHSNLRALTIANHGGVVGPSWLCLDIWLTNLESLILEGISWSTLPPFAKLPNLEDLKLKKIPGMHQFGLGCGGAPGKCFMRLKTVKFCEMPDLAEWVVEPNCHSFPSLEEIICVNCPNLRVMPLSEVSFTNLRRLEVSGCPKMSLPSMPHTSTLTDLVIKTGNSRSFYKFLRDDLGTLLSYDGKKLVVRGYGGALASHNLDKVEDMIVGRCDGLFPEELDGSFVFHSVKSLELHVSHLTSKSSSEVLNCFPALSVLKIDGYKEECGMQFPSSSSLQELTFSYCKENGGGIQEDNSLLQSLTISCCGELFCQWPMEESGGAQTICPFPASLRKLDVEEEPSMKSMGLLSNLTSLTTLSLKECSNLTVDGFNPLIAVNLIKLQVHRCNTLAADMLSKVASQRAKLLLPAGYISRLEVLRVDDICGLLVAPICNLLAPALHTLEFESDDEWMEGFTEEQEKALQLLTSLQNITFFDCRCLESLPKGLHRLSSLKELRVVDCQRMISMPKEGLPVSLRKLEMRGYWAPWLDKQIEEIKRTYPDLSVTYTQVGKPAH
ncbi:putative disease resistance protein RGA4 [Triticum dicoccoides]|uniref:putative disease resistance protein RGA4 n=1 Tax=Triticum dicoccoides TaxID=85692 RepID=UPI0018919195|nr:putative disease resistance protein RGA4 [Triticum dicoccoides]XP_037463426.1 putative disease resistance protein RGA4 [Triticum dicoccoides]XP_037463427.1 putative disease resistance protein RGA4 [Triticum dicoccoides]